VSVAVLLLAYFNGNASLCRAVVKVGARLGVVNRDGLSIFNAPVATKQLLFKLLGAFAGSTSECVAEVRIDGVGSGCVWLVSTEFSLASQ